MKGFSRVFCLYLPGRSAAVASLVLTTVLPSFAQQVPPTDAIFEEITDVIEVQVPVNVVGKNGEPVRDLTVEDFRIFDEGDLQEITSLQIIDLDTIQPEMARSRIERTVPPAARRHFLLLFDMSFSSPSSVVRAREAAREFILENLHPTDLAAVAMHTADSGAKLLVTFTPDRAQLARGIDTLGAPQLLALQRRRDPLRFLIEEPSGSGGFAPGGGEPPPDGGGPGGRGAALQAYLDIVGEQIVRMEKSFHRGRIDLWSSSMADLARSLDSVRGRKHIVLFSEGFDGRLLLGRRPDVNDPEMQRDYQAIESGELWMVDTDDMYGNTSLQNAFHRMLEEFRRADCVIQAINISGLRAATASEERSYTVGEDALFYIAHETGGKLYEDANDFGDQLESLLERTSVTYLLTFQPTGVMRDGSYHKLKVKADLPAGARMSYRTGYYAPRPFQDLHPFEKSLLAADAVAAAAPSRDVGLNVLVAPFRAGELETYVPVIVEVNGRTLLNGHEEENEILPIEFYTYVTNERGEVRDFFTQAVSVDLGKLREAFETSGLKYYGHLDLTEPGEYLVRIVVRNSDTGRTGVETVTLDIPEYGTGEPVLLPPFFIEELQRWLLVRESRDDAAYQKTVVYPFTINGEPFVPAVRPELKSNDEVQLCLVAYNLDQHEVRLSGRVLGAGGDEVAGGDVYLRERTITGIDGVDKLLVTFRANGLKAGDYRLQLALLDTLGSELGAHTVPFSVIR